MCYFIVATCRMKIDKIYRKIDSIDEKLTALNILLEANYNGPSTKLKFELPISTVEQMHNFNKLLQTDNVACNQYVRIVFNFVFINMYLYFCTH